MLEKILSKDDCAECKLCCGFYESEIWEVPVNGDGKPFYEVSYNEKGLYICPALGENGCSLSGDEKPFDCKIWPFRVMKLGDFKVIALSPLCKKLNDKPLSELLAFADELDVSPAYVKDYVDGYTILKIL